MTNGWLVATVADDAIARQLAAGFELEVLHPGPDQGRGGELSQLVDAPNVGIVLSEAAAEDHSFVALLKALAPRRISAQLILASPDVRARFPFVPGSWPDLALDEAIRRARMAADRRDGEASAQQQQEQERRQEPEQAPPPVRDLEPEPEAERERAITLDEDEKSSDDASSAREDTPDPFTGGAPPAAETEAPVEEHTDDGADMLGAGTAAPPASAPEPPASEPEPAPQSSAPPQRVQPPEAPPPLAAPAPARRVEPPPYDPPTASVKRAEMRERAGVTATADATAFAPRKLRRGEAELVRIVIHQPKDLNDVIKAARHIDPRATPAPQGMRVGDVSIGARIGVALEVRGAACDGTLQRRTWLGDAIDFSFAVETDADVKQVVILARVFVDDAQIGVLGFTRQVTGPRDKPLPPGDRARLKRHKRVFLSYASRDRETVSAIATAYASAGVEHFWDRTSLKSGEEWSPRLQREIDRCDLFHLCWSKSAADSEWVEKEATHAVNRRRQKKKPDITVQMLDGPPWAKHPASLDSINFDDFVRAAIVGYARGAED